MMMTMIMTTTTIIIMIIIVIIIIIIIIPQTEGLYRTGLSSIKPRNFCWPSLPEVATHARVRTHTHERTQTRSNEHTQVDTHVTYFAGRFDLYDQVITIPQKLSYS